MPVTIKCQICGKEFEVKNYRKNTAKYCSYECSNKARALQVGEYITKTCPSCNKEFSVLKSKDRKYCCKQCQHDRFELYTTYRCDVCGKEFTLKKSRLQKLLSGKQKNLTCSIECASIIKHTGMNIVCDNCGKEFYRRQDHIDRNNKHSFCCNECQYEFTKRNSHEYRRCEICNTEFYCLKSSTQRFCSNKCNVEWQKTIVGIANPLFSSVETQCDYCHKNFYMPKYKIGAYNHKFCSIECRRHWFQNVYSKDEQVIERQRQIALNELKNGVFNNVNTKPQLLLNQYLDDLGIKYEREKVIGFYSIDNYLSEYNLAIEVQGDYWHCHPQKYSKPINETQLKTIWRDKQKHTYLKDNHNIEVLYIWESDIVKNPELCKQLVTKYVLSSGIMNNYQSYNYNIDNNQLSLNKDIILPFQDQKR